MLGKLFEKPAQSQSSASQNAVHQSMAPSVSIHYGIPSTASILAFDPIQRLLAIGTLDGRIKVIGGDNIEGLLMSPKSLPFKNLEFMQNQGFLVTVSNENEIQVWDLEKRCISSNLQWESNITAFSIIYGTHYMYVGDEYGFLSALKYDAEERKLLHLPYHVPPNLIAEGAGISLPDHQSIVGVLSQPCSSGNRVLIAYENGLIILWDVTEDRAVLIRGYRDLQLKEGTIVDFSNNESHTYLNNSLDDEQAEKEISSLCWVSPDGSVIAVGYVDGDILLWNLLVSDNRNGQRAHKSSNDVVKIQLSSGDRRLPVIVLHWSPNKAQYGCGGQLFVYGGEDIGSEEVLTILDLDWSPGLINLKCVDRVDLALHGSFADVIALSDPYEADINDLTSLFLLTNPGQLHFYDYPSLSTFKSGLEKNQSVHAVQYHSIIPTVEPCMTLGKLFLINSEAIFSRTVSETDSKSTLQAAGNMTTKRTRWPLTGGIPCQLSSAEVSSNQRIYIGGYQDGSVRIWDATFPVLSLIFVLGFEMKGIEVDGADGSVSALDLCSATLTLAVGNERGLVCLYRLERNSNQRNLTIVAETKHEVHHLPQEEKNHVYAIFSILNSPVLSLQFVSSGVRLAVGFQCGQVTMLDTGSLSVLYTTDCVSSPTSPIISLAMRTFPDTRENSLKNSESGTVAESAKEVAFVLTNDAHMVLIDSISGKTISSQSIHTKEESTAICMYLLEGEDPLPEGSKKHTLTTLPNQEAESPPVQTSDQNLSGSSEAENPKQLTYLENLPMASLILLCCEDALYFYSLKSIIQVENKFISILELGKPCCWTTIFKKSAEEFGLIIVYQTGEIEIRTIPELELVGDTSLMSILRWNFKNNMNKTMSASDKGQITLVNGCEFALISFLACENEFRIPENSPGLHDKVLAAAADAAVSFSQSQKKTQSTIPGFIGNMMKGLKGEKADSSLNYIEAREALIGHLDSIFSRFPFSEPDNAYDVGDLDLHIDDIEIDEPVPTVSSSLTANNDRKGKETEREMLFEGGTADTKPRARTREEIIAKYRNTGDASTAAAQAKEKLIERQEKLEKLSRRTEELQSGAENFASMANELAKAMEKRKWWNI
ncbi:isoform 5 of syntaxin-binding 5-like [Olea europaea subsp. europaea]|uniref:Isoform 5 of syntaxin-binding 5-like n=1 Tax=Olea europaea subsp. europaea TaxID=158383 RepID=A0A8S0RTP0_OLEEU|nr:isoform 5 of syntaxin-binding 5-like [Olea europaea subsp. europaea]